MISIDGNKLHLVLANGSLDIAFRGRNELSAALGRLAGKQEAPGDSEHVMFEDGIYGL